MIFEQFLADWNMAVCTLDTNRKAGTSTVSGIGSRKRNVDDRHHKGVKIGLTLSAFWAQFPLILFLLAH